LFFIGQAPATGEPKKSEAIGLGGAWNSSSSSLPLLALFVIDRVDPVREETNRKIDLSIGVHEQAWAASGVRKWLAASRD
jgi:hypothetical protein